MEEIEIVIKSLPTETRAVVQGKMDSQNPGREDAQ